MYMFYPVTMTNTQQKLFERGFQTKACDQVHLEKNTYKNEYRSGVKLKPLVSLLFNISLKLTVCCYNLL
ncbi:UNVERIFIED_CONTAM: hypothetical protein NCL1_60014 [Trichonephila clavipes]